MPNAVPTATGGARHERPAAQALEGSTATPDGRRRARLLDLAKLPPTASLASRWTGSGAGRRPSAPGPDTARRATGASAATSPGRGSGESRVGARVRSREAAFETERLR
jgi:hypothetical protein